MIESVLPSHSLKGVSAAEQWRKVPPCADVLHQRRKIRAAVLCTGMLGCGEEGMQGCGDARMWGSVDVGKYGRGDTGMWGCRDVRRWEPPSCHAKSSQPHRHICPVCLRMSPVPPAASVSTRAVQPNFPSYELKATRLEKNQTNQPAENWLCL